MNGRTVTPSRCGADLVVAKAETIAQSLQLGMAVVRGELPATLERLNA